MKSVHDNFIVGYEVHCELQEIRLLTEDRRPEKTERVVVIFTGVEAYNFCHDCMGNIIFGIEEVSAEHIICDHLNFFQEGFRLSGWPKFWRNSPDEVNAYLKEQGIRGFELSSSYGMNGWILARKMVIQ